MTPATFYTQLAEGPDDGAAWWVTAADGTRLRVVAWPSGTRGTVLLFPGRNEHAEKYGRIAVELGRRGYAAAVVDWRGQGMSDRSPGCDATGHVGDFAEYQADVAALVGAVRWAGLPEPYFLLAHSMGGAIGLRALTGGLPVRAAAFSAPMWGIEMAPYLRPVAHGVTAVSRIGRFEKRSVPVGRRESYLLVTEFDANALTTDPDMYAWMSSHARHDPRLALGRPTIAWLREALAETRRLRRAPRPSAPTFIGIASGETIVDNRAIRSLAATWPEAVVEEYAGARHELMMERGDIRGRFLDSVAALFGGAA